MPLYTLVYSGIFNLIIRLFHQKTVILQKLSETMKNKESNTSVVYNRDTIEFITVSKEFCSYIENIEGTKREDFTNTMLKLLPLLYLKANMLPECPHQEDVVPEQYVTEDSYEIVRMNIAGIMADMDDYLEVFMQDMVYSDKPIISTISENIADIYQDIRDLIFSFQLGYDEVMEEAVAVCKENFELYWGQKLTNVLRALHNVRYSNNNECGEDDDDCCCDDDCCHHHHED